MKRQAWKRTTVALVLHLIAAEAAASGSYYVAMRGERLPVALLSHLI